jgi:hypothetical protein
VGGGEALSGSHGEWIRRSHVRSNVGLVGLGSALEEGAGDGDADAASFVTDERVDTGGVAALVGGQ